MDRATVAVYEREAAAWEARRSATAMDELARFASRLPATGVVADLGTGPGWYAAALRRPVVALDAAAAMLRLARQHAPDAAPVQADLEALPFARRSLVGAWARNSYVHVPDSALPLALADLHGALVVDAPVQLTCLAESPEPIGDDFPGRYFSRWSEARLRDVVVGAGFTVDAIDVDGQAYVVRATRRRRLADTVGPDMRLLLVGLNPSLYAADAGVGFARPGNRFWPAATAAGIVTRTHDPRHALVVDGVGMTDLVKRATVAAAELTADEYADGLARIERLVTWLQPGAVCFLGLAGWRAAADRRAASGPQTATIGGRPVYVMPNPSGLNAHARVADLAEHLAAAAQLGAVG